MLLVFLLALQEIELPVPVYKVVHHGDHHAVEVDIFLASDGAMVNDRVSQLMHETCAPGEYDIIEVDFETVDPAGLPGGRRIWDYVQTFRCVD
ncbi:hypothetical protein [Sphingomicrobium sediminis]|uniref:Uncharacterized protein n=1 Tax=Sphingomicrobium sediminis TaxID=2950949 RepID=A0A9X2J406_9SPHN|nr:hypothetical protein [Sphingomicrobium sediminis]MCM8556737.1 hypothetical protein [Sphingomicrobium sediminis]